MTHRHSSLRLDPGVGGTAARDGGFGLVELMVSMLIGLVIIAALVTLFVNTSGNNRELARANTMIENGRFAIKVLEENLVHAGYWGGFLPMFDDQTALPVPTDAPTALPNPCLAYSSANWNAAYKTNLIGIPLQVYDAPTAADLAACVTAGIIVVADYQAGTDLLVVRHADTCAADVAVAGYCAAITANQLYMQAGFCGTEATPYVLDTSGFTLNKRDCGGPLGPADRRKFVSNIYWVRNFAVTAGDGIPTLVRSQFDLVSGTLAHQPPVALVEGVEAFRIELGVDDVSKTGAAVNYGQAIVWQDPLDKNTPTNRGDGVPDGDYIRCTTLAPCAVADLENVTSVKIYVLARSRQASPSYTDTKTYTLGGAGSVGPFNDKFKRHVFTSTVRLTNVGGRRITP